MDTTENKEALIVLAGSIGTAITGLVSALPIPTEIKVPLVAFIGSISAAILVYWKTQVNKIVE